MKATATLRLCLLFAWITIGISCKKESAPLDHSAIQFVTASTNPDAKANSKTSTPPADTMTDTVYICVSKGAKKYHYDQSCRGLKRCTHTVETTTKKKAEAIGLTVCGYEN